MLCVLASTQAAVRCLHSQDAIRNAESLIRPAAFPGNQTVLLVNNVTLLTSEPEPRVLDRATLLVDYAGSVAPDTWVWACVLYYRESLSGFTGHRSCWAVP